MIEVLTKHAMTWAATGMLLIVPLPASAAQPATADTKTISYRGMHLEVPRAWTVRDYRQSEDLLIVMTKAGCDRAKAVCPYFQIAGPRKIHGSKDPHWIGETYQPGSSPYHPETSVTACRFQKGDRESERFSGGLGRKPLKTGERQVGKGHQARYYAWAGECIDAKLRVTRRFVQREWYLPKEKIVIVDGWDTAGLAGVIKRATWN
uniref:hypothetical protein n=1 Tax=Nonomuraea bangladeshensis TaxID=404385 RepID=UPI003F495401